jgi:hypothetical protein
MVIPAAAIGANDSVRLDVRSGGLLRQDRHLELEGIADARGRELPFRTEGGGDAVAFELAGPSGAREVVVTYRVPYRVR